MTNAPCLLFVVLLALKVTGTLEMSWWLVALPLAIPVAIPLAIAAVFVLMYAMACIGDCVILLWWNWYGRHKYEERE